MFAKNKIVSDISYIASAITNYSKFDAIADDILK